MRPISSALLILPLLLSACSEPPARQEIPEVREPGALRREAPPKLDVRQRLGMRSDSAMGSSQGVDDPLGGITFHHDMPEGWEKVPNTSLRQVNLRMTDTPEAEAYFTFLPGGGGGLKANLNRWRGQMGQEPLSDDAIAALPTKAIFGQPATFILIDGDFVGMGTDPKADYRMYGLVLTYSDPQSQQDQAFFLKMTGPRAVLEGQEAAFDLIASSLHAVAPGDEHSHDNGAAGEDHTGHNHGADGDDHGDHDGHDHGAEGDDHAGHDHGAKATDTAPMTSPKDAPVESEGEVGFSWTVPEGWSEATPSMMRLANLTVDGHDNVECYFTVLGGTGGGLEMNINRWRKQMGQDELSSDAIAALPKLPLLGGDATFVTIDGTFGGMSGSTSNENFRMYGLARVDEGQAFFVKMTGPEAVLAEQEAQFLAFSKSISLGPVDPAAEAPVPAAPAPMAANPHGVDDPTPPGGNNPQGLSWTAPEGWVDGGERLMRVVTFETGETECYITSLPGEAGGVNGNLNRWAGQMGAAQLDEAALAALPMIQILGKEAPMLDVTGSFTGMSGGTQENYRMLGTVVPAGDHTMFVKMIGPDAEVGAQKDNFVAFCASITM